MRKGGHVTARGLTAQASRLRELVAVFKLDADADASGARAA